MIYVYQCEEDDDGYQFELRRSVEQRDEPAECPSCGAPARRVFAAGIVIGDFSWRWGWSGADLDPEPDKRPEFGRKCWPTRAYSRPQENRGRF